MTPQLPQGRRRKLGALRLVREDSFDEPTDYPRGRFRCDSPESVVRFMRPYVDREEVETDVLAKDEGRAESQKRDHADS